MTKSLLVDGRTMHFVSLERLETKMKFDIRYARADNFVKKIVYPSANAFLLKHVAQDLSAVHSELAAHGYGLLIFDGYRPRSVTRLFWDLSNEHDRQFLADPAKGSTHNRGCAVDLSLFEINTGKAVEMPSDFDEMNEKAYVAYPGGTSKSRELRDLLQLTMKKHSFLGIKNEWWHFNHASQFEWPVMDFSFSEILESLG